MTLTREIPGENWGQRPAGSGLKSEWERDREDRVCRRLLQEVGCKGKARDLVAIGR